MDHSKPTRGLPACQAILTLCAAILLVGCTAAVPLPSGAVAVRTDNDLLPDSASGVLCNPDGTIPEVSGVLQGDPSDAAWPVWIQAADGRRMYVVWPKGFSARFDPTAALLDETGKPILNQGSALILGQFNNDPTTGTKDQPYVAFGAWSTGLAHTWHCYTYRP